MKNSRDATLTDAGAPGAGPTLGGGALVGGRYDITRLVAAGGMGEVYEAADRLLGDRVALKLLREELLVDDGAQARFADEIRLARKVTHPNVCRVFDVGVDGARVFYTMELHSGATLKEYLARSGPLAIADARPIVEQMLAGVGAAHEADVIHADLKPSNVLLEEGGRVIVTDFGLARPCCAMLGREGASIIGTPAYMAPEQVMGGLAVGRTDLFAVGVILFEMLAGRLPWDGDGPIELAQARLRGDPPSLRALDPRIDARWDEAIRACLQADRDGRPKTALEVARALGLA